MAEYGTENNGARVHDMRFCSNCGISLTGTERFCSTCGNKIVGTAAQDGFRPVQDSGTESNAYPVKQRKSNAGLIVAGAAVVAVMLVVCLIMIFSMRKTEEHEAVAGQNRIEVSEKTEDIAKDEGSDEGAGDFWSQNASKEPESNGGFWSQNAATSTPLPTPTTVPLVRKEASASLQSTETKETMDMYNVTALYSSQDGYGQVFGFSGNLAENVGVVAAVALDESECYAGYTFSGTGKEVLKNVEIMVVEDGNVATYTTLQNPNVFYNIEFTMVSYLQGECATFDIAIDFDRAGDRYLFEAEGTAMYQEAQPVPTQPEPDYTQCICRGTRICQVCFGWGSLMGETCQGCHGDRTCQYCK